VLPGTHGSEGRRWYRPSISSASAWLTPVAATRHPEMLLGSADAVLRDPRFGVLVIPWGRAQSPELVPQLGKLARRHGKPVCLVWMSQFLEGSVAEAIERRADVSLFRSLDACFAAVALWRRGGGTRAAAR
jgi:hypothetical protein